MNGVTLHETAKQRFS